MKMNAIDTSKNKKGLSSRMVTKFNIFSQYIRLKFQFRAPKNGKICRKIHKKIKFHDDFLVIS